MNNKNNNKPTSHLSFEELLRKITATWCVFSCFRSNLWWKAPSRRARPCRSASCVSGAVSRSNWTRPSTYWTDSPSRNSLVCTLTTASWHFHVSYSEWLSVCLCVTSLPPQPRWSQWPPANRLTAARGRRQQRWVLLLTAAHLHLLQHLRPFRALNANQRSSRGQSYDLTGCFDACTHDENINISLYLSSGDVIIRC